MQAIMVEQPGKNYQLKLQEIADIGSPDKDEVQIDVIASGINRADVLQAQGLYPPPPHHSPVLGLEVAGRVSRVGDPSLRHWSGKRVCCLTSGGGYASKVNVKASHLITIPDHCSDIDAGGLAEVMLTAYQALFTLAQSQPGERILIHAGASGVGLAASQLAAARDCQVAVTSSSAEKLAHCAANGASLLVNYRQQDFVETLEQEWNGVDVIIDVVGGDYFARNIALLNLDGRMVQLALLGGRQGSMDVGQLLAKRLTVMGSTLRNRSDEYKAELVAAFVNDFYNLLACGQLNANIQQQVAPRQAGEAHQRLANNQTVGKWVINWQA